MTKKLLSIILTLCLCLSLLGTVSVGAEGYSYKVSNGKATIIGIGNLSGDISIPSTLGGYPVTSIADYVFDNYAKVTSVTIPDSVTNIEDCAFYGCTTLANIIVNEANAAYSSQDGVLFNKDKTEIICYPPGKTATSFVIPDTVTKIGYRAFYYCTNLTSVTISDSVTYIDSSAFIDCTNLTDITIPDSVIHIDNGAFCRTALTSITIPGSVTFLDPGAFGDCACLTSINVNEANTVYSSQDGVLFNKAKTELLCYPDGKIATSYAIPNGVTSIGLCAFDGCVALAGVIIPQSIASIGNSAFISCTSLANITISNKVESIEYNAFDGCSNLATVYYNGTSSEFNQISIYENNEPLNNATKVFFHYVDFGEYSTKVSNIENGNKVILALYKGKKMTDMQAVNFNSENIKFTSNKEYDTAKVFVWKNLENIEPVKDAVILTEN